MVGPANDLHMFGNPYEIHDLPSFSRRYDMTFRGSKFLFISLAAITASLVLAFGFTQELPTEAQAPYDAGLTAMNQAIAQDVPPFPDQPLWLEAATQAQMAVDAAPTHPLTLGLLAEVYSRSNFHFRAWNAWTAYLEAGYVLNPIQAPLFLAVGEEMAWSAYDRGDLETAAAYQLGVLDAVPFSKEARVWLGRIYLELGRPSEAVPYWQAVVDQDPSDERARYFLDLARDQARWGADAETAFRDGITAYESGDLVTAAQAFARATLANDNYPEAWAWRGRVAFEREAYDLAATFYGRAAELDENPLYEYFEREAARRVGS